MANPGPASTQTSNYLLNGSAADGVLIGIAGGLCYYPASVNDSFNG